MATLAEARIGMQEYQSQFLDSDQMREFSQQVQIKGIELLHTSGTIEALERVKSAANEGRLFDKTEFLDMDYPEERRRVKLAKSNNSKAPGPESRYIKLPGGNVGIELGWRYRQESSMFRGGQKNMVHDSLRVTVQPISGDIVISGNENELVSKEAWTSSDDNSLLSAIERALKFPGRQAEPILERAET